METLAIDSPAGRPNTMTAGNEQATATKPGIKRTRYAKEGVDFAVLFAAKFLNTKVSGYTPELAAPAGVSTGGGAQALQHITLSSAIPGQPTQAVGWVNIANNSAKLRTFECVRQLSQRRVNAPKLAISSTDYQEFFDKVFTFLKQRQMQVTIETKPPEVEPTARVNPGATVAKGRAKWVKVWAILATLLLLAVLLYLALKADVLF